MTSQLPGVNPEEVIEVNPQLFTVTMPWDDILRVIKRIFK